MDVRAATWEDVEGIQRVAHRSWTAAYADVLGQETIDAQVAEWYSNEFIKRSILRPESSYFVVTVDGEVVGYASGGPSETGEDGELYTLYVDPDHWGNGLGTHLVECVEADLRDGGFDRMRIRVLAENEVGISFYESRYERTDAGTTNLMGEAYDEYVYYGKL